MNKPLLCAAALSLALGSAQATTLLDEGFEDLSRALASGWFSANLSSPVGPFGWEQGIVDFDAHLGSATSYAVVGYQSAAESGGSIDAWLLTPTLALGTSNTLSFWTRAYVNPSSFPDRLEVRLSTAGASTLPADFSTTLVTINEGLTETDYPGQWTQYTISFALGQATDGRIAFRYNPPNNIDFADTVGVDSVLVTTAAVPEPASAVLMLLGLGLGGVVGLRRRVAAA